MQDSNNSLSNLLFQYRAYLNKMKQVTSSPHEIADASFDSMIHTTNAKAGQNVNIAIWDSAFNTYLRFPQTQRIYSWTTTLVSKNFLYTLAARIMFVSLIKHKLCGHQSTFICFWLLFFRTWKIKFAKRRITRSVTKDCILTTKNYKTALRSLTLFLPTWNLKLQQVSSFT